MEIFTILFKSILSMFITISVGALAYKKNIISDEHLIGLNNILAFIILPCLIVSNFCISYSQEVFINLIYTTLLGSLVYIIPFILSSVCFKSKEQLERFTVIFSNTGFIGIPLVQATIGEQYVIYMSVHLVATTILAWTLGVYILSNDKREINAKKIIKNPCVYASIIGILIFLLDIPISDIIYNPIREIGMSCTLISFIIIGCYLAKTNIGNNFKNIKLYKLSILRLLGAPIITGLLLCLVPSSLNEIKLLTIITACTPVGAIITVLAQMYNKRPDIGAFYIIFTTALSALTLPLIVQIFYNLWI